jgi:hypothetical protein
MFEEGIRNAYRTVDPSTELGQQARSSPFFQRAKEKARRVVIGGRELFILEGDLLLDEAQLLEYALEHDKKEDLNGLELLGVAHNGKMVRWKPGLALSYYLARETFPSSEEYKMARDDMAKAAEDWMAVCGVQFDYRSEFDDDPSKRPGGALFSVEFVDAGGRFIAAAFFPDYPPARRLVVMDPSFFYPDLGFSRVGVLRHELGHVLGFRHEHIKSGAPAGCPGEELYDTIDLTPYDPDSVMHYFCGGVGSRTLEITEKDRDGAQRVYGLPFVFYEFCE